MPLTTEQSKRKKKADEIELSVAQSMIAMSLANDRVTSFCRSFTEEDVEYKVTLDRSQEFIKRCSYPDMSYLCKHIFFVSRTQAIPYSDKSAFSRRPVEEVDGSGDAVDITENKEDYQAILREQQRLLRVNMLSESLEQACVVLGAQIKELNKSSQRDPDFWNLCCRKLRT
ncbi:hypothetical protein RMATCC62417_14251 [Rhizopus microsporus]|nr:hypothetical protein RMATCC62417_14251 [Rhizopus microsporus]